MTAREIAPAEAEDRIRNVMAQAKALRTENEALWVALQVELARQAETR